MSAPKLKIFFFLIILIFISMFFILLIHLLSLKLFLLQEWNPLSYIAVTVVEQKVIHLVLIMGDY